MVLKMLSRVQEMTKPDFKLLLVEDNAAYAQFISRVLETSGSPSFAIHHVKSLAEACTKLKESTFDGIVLDLYITDSEGLSTLEGILKTGIQVPIVVVTGLSDETIGIQAVRAGAEEYLLKDEIQKDTLGRLLTIAIERWRRKQASAHLPRETILRFQNLELDILKQTLAMVKENEKTEIALTSTEFRILTLLLHSIDQPLSRSQIVSQVWGEHENSISHRTVDKHISSLKQKCHPALDNLQSIHGVGYQLVLK